MSREQALALYAEGNVAEALAVASRAMAADPFLLNLAAVCHVQLGRPEQAIACWQRAIAIDSDHVDAYSNLGAVLHSQQRLEEAESAYRQVLQIRPDRAETYYDLGNLLQATKRYPEAEIAYRQAIHLMPDSAMVYNNLGVLLKGTNRPEEAEACYRQALRLKPDHFNAHNNLGILLGEMARFQEAEAAYRQALRFKPDSAEVYHNLGNLLQGMGLYQEAEVAYRQAVHFQPTHGEALANAYHCAQLQCQWNGILADEQAIRQAVAHGVALTPFPLLTLPDEEGQLQRQAAALYVTVPEPTMLVSPRHHPQRDRLRIGYLSADFHGHSVTWLLSRVVAAHHRQRFIIHGYSYGPDSQDAERKRMVEACTIFRNLATLSDRDCAQRIVDDGIDILVDLTGHTKNHRPGITCLRPAPILVNWLGFPATLGHPRLADYIIGDPLVSPPHLATNFSETLALMPHCFQPNDHLPMAKSPTRQEVGLPAEGFVFCSFNQHYKLRPESFDIWCQLLHAVPGSVLWLVEPTLIARANLRREAWQRGVAPDRLVFAPIQPLAEYLGRLALADLALDTFPFGSGTVGSNTLWSGVPMVTRMGTAFASRMATSLLHNLGLPELITETWEAYFAVAVDLAKNPDRLQALRARLWANRSSYPLFDTEGFTRDLERLYQRMWQDHGEGRRELIGW